MQQTEKSARKLPLGISSFSALIDGGYIYVDKTKFVHYLATTKRPKILTRPRCFGKSTLLSTLEELFLHGVEPYDGHDSYFKELYIADKWRDKPGYTVLHLDFTKINSHCADIHAFEHNLVLELERFAAAHQLKIYSGFTSLALKFDSLLKGMADDALVLLIDDHDQPLLSHWQDDDQRQEAIELLKALYAAIKANSRKLRCVFITGILRYCDLALGIFGNTIEDVSLSPLYGVSCGYTREEIKHYFAEHLRNAATVRSGTDAAAITADEKEALLDEMADWYGGFHFEKVGTSRVFAPMSVLNYFLDPKPLLSACGNRFIDQIFTPCLQLSLSRITTEKLIQHLLGKHSCSLPEGLFDSSSYSFVDSHPLVQLYQAGLLTMRSTAIETGEVNLVIPNREIGRVWDRLTVTYHGKNGTAYLISPMHNARNLVAT